MKKRNFAQRMAMVEEFQSSGVSPEDFASGRDIKLSSLQRWLREASQVDRDGEKVGGFVEVDSSSASAFGSAACRVVIGKASFEFGVLPGSNWLAEFAHSVLVRAKRPQ